MSRLKFAASAFAVVALAAVLLAPAFAAGGKGPKFTKDEQKSYNLAFEKAVAHFEKFKLFLEDDKAKEAVKELRAIIDIDFPEGSDGTDGAMLQVEAHTYLGEMLTEQGDYEGAVKTLLEGVKKAPDVDAATYDLYMALGHAYKKLKKNDEALAAFDKAEKINKILKDREEKAKEK